MAKHRPFTDNAGYTRHCWECKHATAWMDTRGIPDMLVRGLCVPRCNQVVSKTDSPNNPCSIAAGCEHYER